MSDIAERLRELVGKNYVGAARPTIAEAADEIDRLDKLAVLQGQEIRITRERDEALENALLDALAYIDLHQEPCQFDPPEITAARDLVGEARTPQVKSAEPPIPSTKSAIPKSVS